jgi:dTDP-glucose 4,6-dehydratase
MNKVLITGGAGFIGTNFIFYLRKLYPEIVIVCIDKLTYAGNLKNLEEEIGSTNFHFYQGDICNLLFIEDVFQKHSFDAIINFAAESHVDRSIESPEVFLMSNYIGVFNLLETARKYNSGRFHQVSTDEVYGDLPLENIELLFDENSPLKPSSPYSASKAAADLLVLAYHRTFGMNVTISRCSNNYGEYQHREKLIPKVISKAIKNEKIPLYGEGLNVRDWINVVDHCSAILTILLEGNSGEVYNVGGEYELKNISLIKMILEELNKPFDLITFVPDRLGHDKRYAINNSKLKGLGWNLTRSLNEDIQSLIKHYGE